MRHYIPKFSFCKAFLFPFSFGYYYYYIEEEGRRKKKGPSFQRKQKGTHANREKEKEGGRRV